MVERCRRMADSIGERRIFEKKLLPLLRNSARSRKAGALGVQLVHHAGFLSGFFRANGLGKKRKAIGLFATKCRPGVLRVFSARLAGTIRIPRKLTQQSGGFHADSIR